MKENAKNSVITGVIFCLATWAITRGDFALAIPLALAGALLGFFWGYIRDYFTNIGGGLKSTLSWDFFKKILILAVLGFFGWATWDSFTSEATPLRIAVALIGGLLGGIIGLTISNLVGVLFNWEQSFPKRDVFILLGVVVGGVVVLNPGILPSEWGWMPWTFIFTISTTIVAVVTGGLYGLFYLARKWATRERPDDPTLDERQKEIEIETLIDGIIPSFRVFKFFAGFMLLGQIALGIFGAYTGGLNERWWDMALALLLGCSLPFAGYILKTRMFKSLIIDKRSFMGSLMVLPKLAGIFLVMSIPALTTMAALNFNFTRDFRVKSEIKKISILGSEFSSKVRAYVSNFGATQSSEWKKETIETVKKFETLQADQLNNCKDFKCLEKTVTELIKFGQPVSSMAKDQFASIVPPKEDSPYVRLFQTFYRLYLHLAGKEIIEPEEFGGIIPALAIGGFLDFSALFLLVMLYGVTPKRKLARIRHRVDEIEQEAYSPKKTNTP